MNFFRKKAQIFAITLIMSMTIGLAVPSRAHAVIAWPDIVGAIAQVNYQKMLEIIAEIQKGVIMVVLIRSIITQVDQIINDAGGRITDWRQYMYGDSLEIAKVRTLNELTKLTRGSYLLQDTNGTLDSAQERIASFATRALSSDSFNIANYAADYQRGLTLGATRDPNTGKSNLTNIVAITAALQPENSFMAGQIGEDLLAKFAEQETTISIERQKAVGVDSVNPSFVNSSISAMRSSVMNAILSETSPVVRPIVSSVTSLFLNKLEDKAYSGLQDVLEENKALQQVYNATGGFQQFRPNF